MYPEIDKSVCNNNVNKNKCRPLNDPHLQTSIEYHEKYTPNENCNFWEILNVCHKIVKDYSQII